MTPGRLSGAFGVSARLSESASRNASECSDASPDGWPARLVSLISARRRRQTTLAQTADLVRRMNVAVNAWPDTRADSLEGRQKRVLTLLYLMELTDFDSIKRDLFAANGPLREFFDTLDELQAGLSALPTL